MGHLSEDAMRYQHFSSPSETAKSKVRPALTNNILPQGLAPQPTGQLKKSELTVQQLKISFTNFLYLTSTTPPQK